MAHRSRLKRGAFRPMLSRLVNLLRAGPVDVQYQGASFRFYHQASATERGALFNPDYNLEELDFLRAHVPLAAYSSMSAPMSALMRCAGAHVGADGKVIAIEPHPVTHARLAFNNTASAPYPGEAGRGRRRARRWRVDDRDRRRKSRRQPHRVGRRSRARRIRVPSLRLQRILEEAGASHVDALKIDVEGFEDRVLTGFFAQAPQALWPRRW
jgi:FkbM family methyltransferase